MSRVTLSALVFAAAAYAQGNVPTFPATPLISFSFPHPTDAPQQVYGPNDPFLRGPQTGYNRCNSTTENQNSLCQTSFVNDITDFCLWAPGKPNQNISDTEGEEVAWCTKKGHGTRIMLDGTLKGVQILNTPDYTMITGLIDQTKINIRDGDSGGELDSGGQDTAGNPIGGLVYSTRFSANNAGQIVHWTEFIGNNQFCIKVCKNDGTNPEGLCQHTLDRIGIGYNCPSKYTLGDGASAGTFEVCDSDNIIVPGIYTLPGGHTTSYAQPPETLGPITTIPYTPVAAASSNCVTSASSALYTDLASTSASVTASASGSGNTSGSAATSKPSSSGSTAASSSASHSGEASGSSTTGASQSGADTMKLSMAATALGTLFAVAFFA